MADEATFAVRLINQATAPARRIARSVRRVTDSMRAAQVRSTALGGAFSRVTSAMRVMGRNGSRVSAFSRDLLRFAAAAATATRLHRGMLAEFRRGVVRASRATIGFLAKDKDVRRLARSFGDLSSRMASMAKNAALVGGGVAALLGGGLVAKVADATVFAERSRLALANLTGSKSGGDKAFQTAINLSKELGLEVQTTTKQYTKLLAAQFTAGRAAGLVRLTADLRAIGATAEEVKSAVRAISQIKAKGRLQAEELVGQLAEAGIATTLVYDALGKTLGKTRDQVRALITAGKVDSDTAIDAIEAAVLKKANIKRAGEAGRKFANATLGGLLARLKAAPSIKFLEIAESSSRGAKALRDVLHSLVNEIASIDPNKAGEFTARVLEGVRNMLPLVREFSTGFGEGFKAVLEGFREASAGASDLQLARDFGRSLAKALGVAVEAMRWLANLVGYLQTPTGAWIAKLTLGALAVGKIATLLGPVVSGFSLLGKLPWGGLLGSLGTAAGWVGRLGGGAARVAVSMGGWLGAIRFGPMLAGLGRMLTLLGPAGLVGAAGLVGYQFGSWIDSVTGASKKLTGFLSRLTGLDDELNKHGKRHYTRAPTPRGMINPRAVAASKAAGGAGDVNLRIGAIHIDGAAAGNDPKRMGDDFARQAGAALQRRRRVAAAR